MAAPDRVREVLQSELVVERLAEIEHERWAHWQKYVHDQCERREDGSMVIPADLAARWQAQIETPYADLSEQEKDSDREQVQRYLPTIVEALA
jgi:hypothetical protein